MNQPLDIVTGDDPVTCALCGKETSIAMISRHLVAEHGFTYQQISDALVVIEACPCCGHTDEHHDENGCDVDGCDCDGP